MKIYQKLLGAIGATILALGSIGCASTHAYDGAIGDRPVVSVEYFRHVDTVTDPQNPKWVKNAILHVSNPSDKRPMSVMIDCDPGHGPGFKGVPTTEGTVTSITLVPRTTQDVLLLPTDGDCTVSEY